MLDFADAPRYVYWETTQRCGLACRHCRATSKRAAHPEELTTGEARSLLRQVAAFRTTPLPTLIFSGGDPLEREDLWDLLDEAAALGIPTAVTPSATARLTRERLAELQRHAVSAISMSLDGATAATHDGIRAVPGCYERTMRAWDWAAALGLPLLVNTVVSAQTVDELPAIEALLRTKRLVRWSLFFLVAVGRGRYLAPISPARAGEVVRRMVRAGQDAPFAIGATEAPWYRRVVLEELAANGLGLDDVIGTAFAAGLGIRDGNGVAFVAKTGDIYPTGFLPLAAGNVRDASLVEVYRHSPLFVGLHDPARLGGACGRCAYRNVCGGSRARAYAATGDPLGADPLCPFVC